MDAAKEPHKRGSGGFPFVMSLKQSLIRVAHRCIHHAVMVVFAQLKLLVILQALLTFPKRFRCCDDIASPASVSLSKFHAVQVGPQREQLLTVQAVMAFTACTGDLSVPVFLWKFPIPTLAHILCFPTCEMHWHRPLLSHHNSRLLYAAPRTQTT